MNVEYTEGERGKAGRSRNMQTIEKAKGGHGAKKWGTGIL